MPQGTYKTGKVVGCTIGGTAAYMASGQVTRSIDTVDVTNSRSAGYQEIEGTIYRAQGSCDAFYRGTMPAAEVGQEVTIVYTIGGSNRFATEALITEIGESNAVAGEFQVSFSWVSTGVFYPYSV